MILLTGITGKSGSWFFKNLIDEKTKFEKTTFRAVVRKTSKLEPIKNSGLNIEQVFGDLENQEFANQITDGVSTILHIAGIGKSLNLVKAAVKNNVKRIILVHTTGIYSKFKSASSEYLEIEKQIKEITKDIDIDLTILRPTMIYGRSTDRNVIIFIKLVDKLRIFPVINKAQYLLQPVHESDLGKAYFQVLTNPEATKNKNYNLSGKEPILLIDMLKIIGQYLGKKNLFISIPFFLAYFGSYFCYIVSLKKFDYREKVQRLVESRDFSHQEASRDFGYSPMGFKEGVKKEVEEYLEKKKK
jgi:nucleoside-diphosphate-sugar epimerase